MIESRSRRVIVISSGKGGVGKSLLASCLSKVLQEDFKVLLVDMDLGVKGITFMYGAADAWEETRGSIMDYLSGNLDADTIVTEAESREGQAIVPASTDFNKSVDWDNFSELEPIKIDRLVETAFEHNFDFVILDTRAGIDSILLDLAKLQPLVIVVLEADVISLTSALDIRGQLLKFTKDFYFVINKSPRAFLAKRDPVLEKLKFLPPLPFDFKLYNRFVRDARGLVHSGFEKTAYKKYVGRLAKTLLREESLPPMKSVSLPTFYDYLYANRASRFLIHFVGYGLTFFFFLVMLSVLGVLWEKYFLKGTF